MPDESVHDGNFAERLEKRTDPAAVAVGSMLPPEVLVDAGLGFGREDSPGSTVYSVIKAAHLIECHLNRSLHVERLTIRQVGALAYIAQNPSSSRAELARAVLTSPQAAGGLVRRLVVSGFIHVAEGGVGSPLSFTLTETGRSALHRALAVVEASELAMLDSLVPSAVVDLDRLLRDVVTGLG
jgi:DNA-binding MarR family transcriptional regulator